MKLELLERLEAARREKRSVCLVRFFASGEAALIVDGEVAAGGPLAEDVLQAAQRALKLDRCLVEETSRGRTFFEIFNPPLRLLLVGAVHIAQALAPMASISGYRVIVIDPRRAFATTDRFPAVELLTDWPDEALQALKPDRRTAVVTLTHDPKLDDPALDVALRSDAFYIAALGSPRTHAKRLERLRALGHDDAALSRIYGPAGLDIGAASPAEIAVSILAEMIMALRRGESARRRQQKEEVA